MFHPVTTDSEMMFEAADNLISACIESDLNYIVIYPNNDLGSNHILRAFEKIRLNKRFKIFPSLRFEYFLCLLKHSSFIAGNSSAGIREAPHYGVHSVNIGTRQQNRALNSEIINVDYDKKSILNGILEANKLENYSPKNLFGDGNSDSKFLSIINQNFFWKTSRQKLFNDKVYLNSR
jgi:UDP-N-acetylglucosamine 2-epimerase (hydrolysing)